MSPYARALRRPVFTILYRQVSIDPEVLSGTPVFAGTRVPVKTLFDYIEGGDSLAAFLEDYPSVTRDVALEILSMGPVTLNLIQGLKEERVAPRAID